MRNLVIIAAALAALGSTARAECREDDKAPIKTHVEMIDGKRVVVIEKEIIICGHPPRPAVAYLTTPKNVEWSWEKLEKSLVPKILESVTHGGIR